MKRLKHLLGYIYLFIREYGYDARRFISGSLIDGYNKTQSRFLGRITLHAHALEKGIAMPNRRYNFGENNLRILMELCNEYADKGFDVERTQFVNAVEIILEYAKIHKENNVNLPNDILESIDNIAKRFPHISTSSQPVVAKDEMFRRGDFRYVAHHRHSVRNFVGVIDEYSLKNALELANTSPSSCNRQQCRVHVVNDRELMMKILKIQQGNRGFGASADKLLVITADVSSYNGFRERNSPYVDGGIFVMNLLYALQYYGIAACTLNCCFSAEDDKEMCKLLHTKDAFIAVIAIGGCNEEMMVVNSKRIKPEEYIILH
jgi:nitroreductase